MLIYLMYDVEGDEPVMMISPEMYIEKIENYDYLDLIKERDNLIRQIRSFEKNEKVGNRSSLEWHINPSPDVRYQCNLRYLTHLCDFMREKFRLEYVWGERELSDDAKEQSPEK